METKLDLKTRKVGKQAQVCWNYKVIRSQRRCLEGLFDDRDDADDEY